MFSELYTSKKSTDFHGCVRFWCAKTNNRKTDFYKNAYFTYWVSILPKNKNCLERLIDVSNDFYHTRVSQTLILS